MAKERNFQNPVRRNWPELGLRLRQVSVKVPGGTFWFQTAEPKHPENHLRRFFFFTCKISSRMETNLEANQRAS